MIKLLRKIFCPTKEDDLERFENMPSNTLKERLKKIEFLVKLYKKYDQKKTTR